MRGTSVSEVIHHLTNTAASHFYPIHPFPLGLLMMPLCQAATWIRWMLKHSGVNLSFDAGPSLAEDAWVTKFVRIAGPRLWRLRLPALTDGLHKFWWIKRRTWTRFNQHSPSSIIVSMINNLLSCHISTNYIGPGAKFSTVVADFMPAVYISCQWQTSTFDQFPNRDWCHKVTLHAPCMLHTFIHASNDKVQFKSCF